jgi:hypothetical protein
MLQDNYRRKHHFTVFNELVQISNSSILNRAARNIGAPLIANAVLFAGEGEFSDELTDDDVLQPFRSLLKRAEDDGSGVCLGVMQPSRGAPDLLQWVGKTVHEWIGHLKATKAQIAPYYDIAMNRLNLMDHELAVVTNRQLRYRTTLAPMVSDVWTQSCKIPKRIASNITPIIAAYLLHSTEFQYTESE